MRARKKEEFSIFERMFVRKLRMAGNSFRKIKMADLMAPICQISPGIFS
jgi:hypothetical protein